MALFGLVGGGGSSSPPPKSGGSEPPKDPEPTPETGNGNGNQTPPPETSGSDGSNGAGNGTNNGNANGAGNGNGNGQGNNNGNGNNGQAAAVTGASSNPPAPKPSSESVIAARNEIVSVGAAEETSSPLVLVPESQDTALAAARAQAEDYRVAATRSEFLRGLSQTETPPQKGTELDIQIPLIDNLPDKPAPGRAA